MNTQDVVNCHPDEFEKLWESAHYGWMNCTLLCKYQLTNIEIWFDPGLYNWEGEFWALCEYCHTYFDVWWHDDIHDIIIEGGTIYHLAKFCSDKFEIWWDLQVVRDCDWVVIREYCGEYETIWAPDYVIYELGSKS